MSLLLDHLRKMCSSIEIAINNSYHKKSIHISDEVLSDVLSVMWSTDNEFLSYLEVEIDKEIIDRKYLELRSKIFLSLDRHKFKYDNGELNIESVNDEFNRHGEFIWWCDKPCE